MRPRGRAREVWARTHGNGCALMRVYLYARVVGADFVCAGRERVSARLVCAPRGCLHALRAGVVEEGARSRVLAVRALCAPTHEPSWVVRML